MAYEDRDLTCTECANTFVFSVDDQQFHAERGYTNEPKRCPSCRASRRAERRGGAGGVREMHPVVCAQCGVNTEVPFLPRGDRPVYCSDCFNQQRSGASPSRY